MTLLADRYELVRPLGEGAMGVVWYALDRELGIGVAVKTLRQEHVDDENARTHLVEEARLCARMSSPHVVKVLGCSPGPGAPFVVYEELEGETLAERLEREGMLPLHLVQDIVSQIGRALARCHAIGVVHRDVKPENVFLVPQPGGRVLVKLIDFGIAQETRRGGGVIAGTPEYMAPEVIVALRPADVRADTYALAVVAYECLTGRRPFAAADLASIRALLGHDAAPVSDFRNDVDVDVDVWMHRALHRDPARRFQTAKSLAESLAALAPVADLAAAA